MNLFQRLFSSNYLNDIFTPNKVAKLTYVSRNVLETDLEKYLLLHGKQIVIYGHSGGGKTTLLRNKLKQIKQNFILTHCETSTTFNELLLQAFDELNKYYISEKTANSEYSISRELKSEFSGISTQISSIDKESIGDKSLRIIPPQLTPQKLAKFLGEINCVWIIEDFHKVNPNEKKRIADVLKIFIDAANDNEKVKIICIGAVGTARELVELDNNLNNRVAELFVPLLTDQEIEQIITKGFELLNVKIDKELKEKIVYYSNNLASITHQICYDLCYHSDIKRMKIFLKRLNLDSFRVAINSYVRQNSDTFTKTYDAIVCHGNGWNVLKSFDNSEKEALSIEEVKSNIVIAKRPKDDDLVNYLDQLGTSEFNEIIRYDRNSKKYSISSPFFRAFLKMKFAIEQSEQIEINAKKRKKQNHHFSIDSPSHEPTLIFDEEFFITYNSILDNYAIRELKLRKDIIKKKNR